MSSSVGMMKFPIYGKFKVMLKVIKFHGSKPPTKFSQVMLQILPERPFSPLRMSRVSPLRPAVAVAPVAQGRAYVGQQRAGAHALRARQAVTGVDVVQTQVGVLSEMGNPLVSGISLLMDCPWLMVPGRINGIGYGLTDGVNRRVNGLMGLVMVIN